MCQINWSLAHRAMQVTVTEDTNIVIVLDQRDARCVACVVTIGHAEVVLWCRIVNPQYEWNIYPTCIGCQTHPK